ncbi:MAG: hypothetical protein SF051_14080 [Elusimicrobiota bacterium]|nr:hypothetical protein [Elusimicrobiota bacterium]
MTELAYDFFEDHTQAAAEIRRRRPLALGVLALLAGGTSLFFAQALAGRLSILSLSWPSLIAALTWHACLAFLTTAVLHLVLEMTGSKGSAGVLFVHWGLSDLAWMSAVPAVLVVQALTPNSPWSVRLVFFLVGIWSLALKARAIRDEYGVASGRAWLTLSVPYLAAMALAALVLALTLAALILAAVRSL